MSSPFDDEDDAATPLDDEEKEGLIPSYITTRSELNQAEQANILEAEEWAIARKRETLSERFLDDLHRRMLGRVWRWAGTHRRSGKSIGIDAYQIPPELRKLIDDCRYWISHHTYPRMRSRHASTTAWSGFILTRTAMGVTPGSRPTCC